jgi:hypothetical protein
MTNGTETPLPAWIQVNPTSSSFVMNADQPFYLPVCVTITPSAPYEDFNVVMNETVNGQQFAGEFVVGITYFNPGGPAG